MPKKSLFISHAAKDKKLALLVKNLFAGRLGRGQHRVKVFCSSDLGSIGTGKEWFNVIIRSLRKSQACVCILTPNSVYRPWVLFEAGGAYLCSKSNGNRPALYPGCALGMKASLLPEPLKHLDVRDFSDPKEVEQLYRDVRKMFGGEACSQTAIDDICLEAKEGSRHWGQVRQCLQGERLDQTPFHASDLLASARKHFFAAGQTLTNLATDSFRDALFGWLEAKKDRKAQFLICNPEERGSVSAWSVVGEDYKRDLTKSVRIFKQWVRLARDQSLSLEVRVTKLVTTSITAVDPDESGTLVITPVVFGRPISGDRPHFVLSKAGNGDAFMHYWATYRNQFSQRSKSVDRVRGARASNRRSPSWSRR